MRSNCHAAFLSFTLVQPDLKRHTKKSKREPTGNQQPALFYRGQFWHAEKREGLFSRYYSLRTSKKGKIGGQNVILRGEKREKNPADLKSGSVTWPSKAVTMEGGRGFCSFPKRRHAVFSRKGIPLFKKGSSLFTNEGKKSHFVSFSEKKHKKRQADKCTLFIFLPLLYCVWNKVVPSSRAEFMFAFPSF